MDDFAVEKAPGGALLGSNTCGHMAEPHRPEIPQCQSAPARQSKPIVNLTAASAKAELVQFWHRGFHAAGRTIQVTLDEVMTYLPPGRNPFESEQLMARSPIQWRKS